MNYNKVYKSIINRARNRKLEGYIELHHIVPRCLGGTDNSDNIVPLTAKEHFVCHQLLIKIYPDNRKLIFAASAMSRLQKSKRPNCREYKWLKNKLSIAKITGKHIICVCGKEVWKTPHMMKGGNTGKYCSKECAYKFRPPVKKRNGSTKLCECCAKEFYCSPSVKQKFCSYKCKGKNTPTRNQEIISCTCIACNIVFDRPACRVKGKQNVFCNNECRLKYTSKVLSTCQVCNKMYNRYKYEEDRKYCSMKCYGQSKKV
jgi:hypothetical protein